MLSSEACVLFVILATVRVSRVTTANNKNNGGKMEGFVVGGNVAKIEDFPHAALLTIKCVAKRGDFDIFSCGSSILNQEILLTAAHCFEGCGVGSDVHVTVGHSYKKSNYGYRVASFAKHPKYNGEDLTNDIALAVLTKPLKYSTKVKRVMVPRAGIYNEAAVLAGWGLIDEGNQTDAVYLQSTAQKVMSREECLALMPELTQGSICATSTEKSGYAAQGDSGSALIVRGYIQIGIVSYKVSEISKSLIVYTDVAYFYDWITKSAKTLFCLK